MNDVRSRLKQCFSSVLTELSDTEIYHASVNSVAAWDSLATVNLIAVMEEEFGVQFRMDELETLVSFDLILDVLEAKVNAQRNDVPRS